MKKYMWVSRLFVSITAMAIFLLSGPAVRLSGSAINSESNQMERRAVTGGQLLNPLSLIDSSNQNFCHDKNLEE